MTFMRRKKKQEHQSEFDIYLSVKMLLKSVGHLEFKIFREIKMQNYTIIRFRILENP